MGMGIPTLAGGLLSPFSSGSQLKDPGSPLSISASSLLNRNPEMGLERINTSESKPW